MLFGALNLFAQENQIFRGEIIDSSCLGPETHSAMSERDEATAQCTVGRVRKGAKYVLADPASNKIYNFANPKKPKPFAGQDVVVTGTVNKSAGAIRISKIRRALPPKILHAKSFYIFCDACIRGMAAAWHAASDTLGEWRRFDLSQDPKKADLIFLFSANPYLGDYVTRDGPDTRQVHVDITFMSVVDPQTGISLWGDSKQRGSWFVTRATKALIGEFKEQLEADEGYVLRSAKSFQP